MDAGFQLLASAHNADILAGEAGPWRRASSELDACNSRAAFVRYRFVRAAGFSNREAMGCCGHERSTLYRAEALVLAVEIISNACDGRDLPLEGPAGLACKHSRAWRDS